MVFAMRRFFAKALASRRSQRLLTASGASARTHSRSSSSRSPWRSRPVLALVLLGFLVVGSIVTGTWVLLSILRDRAIADSERELQNIAFVLAEQGDRSFQAVDLIQNGLIERIQTLRIDSDEELARQMSGQEVHLTLNEKVSGLPDVDAVTLIDSHGKLVNSSRYWPIPDINVADRDYFKALKSNPQLQSFVSEPVPNRGTGTWTIYLARKITDNRTGKFVGLVLGAMQLQYFEQLFAKITLGGDSAIALFRRDGVLLVRHPRRDAPGGSYARGDLFTKVLAHADHVAGVDVLLRLLEAELLEDSVVALGALALEILQMGAAVGHHL